MYFTPPEVLALLAYGGELTANRRASFRLERSVQAWTGVGLTNRPQSLRTLRDEAVGYLVATVGDCTAETIATAAIDLLQEEYTVPNEALLGMLASRNVSGTELGNRIIEAASLQVLKGDEEFVHAHFHTLLLGCHAWFKTLVDGLYTFSTKDLNRDVYNAEIARLTRLEVVLLAWRRQWRLGRSPRRATTNRTIYDAVFIAEQLNGLYPKHPFYRDAIALRLRTQNSTRRISGASLRRRLGRIDPFRLADEGEEEEAG